MFMQPCFIQKCTPALIEKLVKLGYKIIGKITPSYGIFCNKGKIKICSTNEQPSVKDKDFIQCYDNEELFLALVALRNDTDRNQWFTNNNNYWYKCLDNNFSEETANWILCPSADKWHKATIEELIEHFK